jgi:hypothetical protein
MGEMNAIIPKIWPKMSTKSCQSVNIFEDFKTKECADVIGDESEAATGNPPVCRLVEETKVEGRPFSLYQLFCSGRALLFRLQSTCECCTFGWSPGPL